MQYKLTPEMLAILSKIASQSQNISENFAPSAQQISAIIKQIAPAIRAVERYKVTPQMRTILTDYAYKNQQFRKLLAPQIRQFPLLGKQFHRFALQIPSLEPMMEQLREWTRNPNLRRKLSVYKCKTLLHPIYLEMFEQDFSVEDIQSNWEQIRDSLWSRFPDSLGKDKRKERYEQILNCQAIGAYIPVCRSIYAELEALLRDEILFADPELKAEWENKENPNSRRGYLSQKLKALVTLDDESIKLVDSDMALFELGSCVIEFLIYLEKAYEGFDPAAVSEEETTSYRHIHAHGWAKEASFIDGLNGLLAFDMALQLISCRNDEIKKGESING